jgi:hypothetical protein
VPLSSYTVPARGCFFDDNVREGGDLFVEIDPITTRVQQRCFYELSQA